MTKSYSYIGIIVFTISAGLTGLCGCAPTPEEAIRDTDRRVYGTIERMADRGGLEKTDQYRLGDPETDGVSRPTISSTGMLTLPEAAYLAVSGNREYLLERDNLYALAAGVTEVEHLYEPIPFGGVEGRYLREDGQESVGVLGDVGFGLRQLLATGTRIGTQLEIGWVDVLSGRNGLESGFSSVLSAVVTQPLLRGSSRLVVFEGLTQAEQDLLYQIRFFNRYRKILVVSTVQTYYETLQLNDRMDNAFQYYLRLSDIYSQIQKQAAVGRVPLYEVQEAQQDRLEAMNRYLALRSDYNQMLDFFKTTLAIRPDVPLQLDIRELEVLKEVEFSELAFSEVAAVEAALNQRLDLANAADRVLDARRHVQVAAELLGTNLDLIGVTSIGSFGASPKQMERIEDLYSLSLRLDLPLDRLAEKNDYRLALVELMQNQRTHQQITDTVILEVRDAFRNLKTAHEQHQVALRALELARKRTENTIRLQQVMRANMRDVLDAQEDLYNAQDDATETLIEYAVASLNLYLATGTLKIQPDGMWDTSTRFDVHARVTIE